MLSLSFGIVLYVSWSTDISVSREDTLLPLQELKSQTFSCDYGSRATVWFPPSSCPLSCPFCLYHRWHFMYKLHMLYSFLKTSQAWLTLNYKNPRDSPAMTGESNLEEGRLSPEGASLVRGGVGLVSQHTQFQRHSLYLISVLIQYFQIL